MMSEKAEDKALESFLDKLARTLEPLRHSTRLLEADVIDEKAWDEAQIRGVTDYERNLAILKAVRKRVRANVTYFHKYCDILDRDEYTKALSKDIQGSRRNLMYM